MLTPYLRRRVSVITTDGRHLVGVLHAADQLLNVILTSCSERLFDDTDGTMQELQMGVMMIRGSDVVCVAAVDTIEEAKVSTKEWRGRNLPAVERVPRAATLE